MNFSNYSLYSVSIAFFIFAYSIWMLYFSSYITLFKLVHYVFQWCSSASYYIFFLSTSSIRFKFSFNSLILTSFSCNLSSPFFLISLIYPSYFVTTSLLCFSFFFSNALILFSKSSIYRILSSLSCVKRSITSDLSFS